MRGIAACLVLAGLHASAAGAEPAAHVPANLVAALDRPCDASARPCDAAPAAPTAVDTAAALRRLEQRLRDTDAVAWLDKLALSARVDELHASFRRHHDSGGAAPLAPLRRRFDSLFDGVLAMVRQRDPRLYRDIRSARPMIWAAFTDPRALADRGLRTQPERAGR